MAIGDPPVTVDELLAKVRKSQANIALHRAAMADVAKQVRDQGNVSADEGVKQA